MNTELFFFHSPYARRVEQTTSQIIVHKKVSPETVRLPVEVQSNTLTRNISVPRVTVLGEYNKDSREIRFFTSRCSDKPNDERGPDNFSRAIGRQICLQRLHNGQTHSHLQLTEEEAQHPGKNFVLKAKEIAETLVKYQIG
jgi:hypothetical protein